MLCRVALDANFPGKLEGVLLCGGRSSRMGRDKALIEVEGEALWLRQRRKLQDVLGKEPLVSVRNEAGFRVGNVSGGCDGASPRYVLDDGSSGPLGGILAAFDAIEAASMDARPTHLAVLAVDMPYMETSWWVTLARACASTRGAIGKWESGAGLEPLAAIYPTAMRSIFLGARADGNFSVQKIGLRGIAAGLLREVPIATGEEAFFKNWNSPSDIDQR